MAEINPLRFTSSVRDTFRRYLFTAHPIGDIEAGLREAFWAKLGDEYPYSSGPYFHCVPTYAPGDTVLELIAREQSPSLHPRFADLPRAVFDPARRLYRHQSGSIAALQRGRNLLVASGTGSGKTECFLLPILDAILRAPGPGVRAVIVYPLNALANDQLERLRDLLGKIPEVTFGRYTGETPWSEKDAKGTDFSRCPKNERYLRTQLREDPPNVLLTNFSMLEYLLLRPRDSEVFRHKRLQFVVLDEAHSYTGAQGIEVALLLRRVCAAFASPNRSPQFVLTSATLMEAGRDSRVMAAEMASNLTGSSFDPSDVITGETVDSFDASMPDRGPAALVASLLPGDDSLDRWCDALDGEEGVGDVLREAGLVRTEELARWPSEPQLLHQLLAGGLALERAYPRRRRALPPLRETGRPAPHLHPLRIADDGAPARQ